MFIQKSFMFSHETQSAEIADWLNGIAKKHVIKEFKMNVMYDDTVIVVVWVEPAEEKSVRKQV